jgi:hypothetical protein
MRILLDECVTQAAAIVISQFLEMDADVEEALFSLDFFKRPGVKDHTIATELASLGDWYVVTADRDKKRKSKQKRAADGPPLHLILPQKRISAVYMSGAIQKANTQEKIRAVISQWPDIKRFFLTSPPGSRILLAKASRGAGFHLRDY